MNTKIRKWRQKSRFQEKNKGLLVHLDIFNNFSQQLSIKNLTILTK